MFQRSLLLTQLLIRGGDFSLGTGAIAKKRKAKSGGLSILASTAGKVVLYLFLMAYVGVLSFIVGRSTTQVAVKQGIADQIPLSTVPMICMAILIFGFVFIVTAFYHTNNTETLLAMPFRPAEIISARYLQVVSYLYVSVAGFFVPYFIAYGIYSGQSWIFYPAMFLFMAAIPFLALAPITILIMLLMRFTKFFKNKDRFTTVSTILILLVSFGLSTTFNIQNASRSAEGLGFSFSGSVGQSLKTANWVFLGADFGGRWLMQADQLTGWLFGLLFLVCTALWLALLLFVAQKAYFKGVMSVSNVDSKGQKLSAKESAALSGVQGHFATFWQKEIRVLLRTPAFFSNNVLLCFLMPLIMLVPLYFSFNAAGTNIFQSKAVVQAFLSQPGALDGVGPIILMIVLGVGLFLSGSNGIAAGALSREGAGAYLMKLYPYSFMKQLMAKLAVGFLFSLVTPLILLVVAQVLFGLPLVLMLPVSVLLLLGVLLVNLLGLWSDMLMPKLNWANEQQAAKQNWNVLIEMFGGLLLAGLGIVLMYFVDKYAQGFWPVFGAGAAFLLLACGLMFFLIKQAVPRTMRLLAE